MNSARISTFSKAFSILSAILLMLAEVGTRADPASPVFQPWLERLTNLLPQPDLLPGWKPPSPWFVSELAILTAISSLALGIAMLSVGCAIRARRSGMLAPGLAATTALAAVVAVLAIRLLWLIPRMYALF